jgi:hypothetical protein
MRRTDLANSANHNRSQLWDPGVDCLGRQESLPSNSYLIDDKVGSDPHARQITHVRVDDILLPTE